MTIDIRPNNLKSEPHSVEHLLQDTIGFDIGIQHPLWLNEIVESAKLDSSKLGVLAKYLDLNKEYGKLSVLTSSLYVKKLVEAGFLINCAYLVGSSAMGSVNLDRVSNNGRVSVIEDEGKIMGLKLLSEKAPYKGWRSSDVDLEIVLQEGTLTDRTTANKYLAETLGDLGLSKFPFYAVINDFNEFSEYINSNTNGIEANYIHLRTLLTPVLPIYREANISEFRKKVGIFITKEAEKLDIKLENYPSVKLARGYSLWKKLERDASLMDINQNETLNTDDISKDLLFYAMNRIEHNSIPSKPIYIDSKSYTVYLKSFRKEADSSMSINEICPPPLSTFSKNLHVGQMLSTVISDILFRFRYPNRETGFRPLIISYGPYWDKLFATKALNTEDFTNMVSDESSKNLKSISLELNKLGIATEQLQIDESRSSNLVNKIYNFLLDRGYIDIEEEKTWLNLTRLAKMVNLEDLEKRLYVFPLRKKKGVIFTIKEIAHGKIRTQLNGGGTFSLQIPDQVNQTFYPLFVSLCLAGIDQKFMLEKDIICGINTYPQWLVDNILLSEALGYEGGYRANLYNLVSDERNQKIDRKNNNLLVLSDIETGIVKDYIIRKQADKTWLDNHIVSVLRYFLITQIKGSTDKTQVDFSFARKSFGLIRKIVWLKENLDKKWTNLPPDKDIENKIITMLSLRDFRSCMFLCQDEIYKIAKNVQKGQQTTEDLYRFVSIYTALRIFLPTV